MKTAIWLGAWVGILGGFSPLRAVEEQVPTLRETGEWIIISGNAEDGSNRGPLPWMHAIRKSAVVSVTIETDFFGIDQSGSGEGKKFHAASAEEIGALPAHIRITTTELASGGDYRQYWIRGLTHASAPAMLEEILRATVPPGAAGYDRRR